MPSLLGIDSGLTVTKAVLFDVDGRQLAVSRRRVPQSIPQPHHVEREMDLFWVATADAIREAIALSGRPASDIQAVGTTAHGDGVYLLDHNQKTLGAGILSLDSRAGALAEAWSNGPLADTILNLTGQLPHASAPSALLAWIKQYQPERFAQIGHVLSCKDWMRFCLTGEIGTDCTEASASFCDVRTQIYSRDALELFNLTALWPRLPPISRSDAVVAGVSRDTANRTGLTAGTPVVAGLHDVTASALGMGGYGKNIVAVIAGTYSINETISSHPHVSRKWFCRNGITEGEWNNMAISPASTTNYDWFVDQLCTADARTAKEAGQSIHDVLGGDVDLALQRDSTVFFHPYLFGSPFGPSASAGFFGLNGWHDRGDMVRAVLEGIAFNHRIHVDDLAQGFCVDQIRLTGGISRNCAVAQLFCDILNLPLTVTTTEEAAAWGAALCAGAGVGVFETPRHDPRNLAAHEITLSPSPARVDVYQKRFEIFKDLAAAMQPVWARVASLHKTSEN
ncbi:FGGY-family carbohydrate kinase [Rhizobium sp.]|jgi:L-xylulokinase|uniref:FGGY-family carbohydrate kinase n=1 Tax=Rhizobium sp. TaxID=391 RepID=UPI000E841042|nr:carbohydrate kinase [Rhizobium sp.]